MRCNHEVMRDADEQRDDFEESNGEVDRRVTDMPAILQKGSNNDIIIVFEIKIPTFKMKLCRQSGYCSLEIVLGSCSHGVGKGD